MPNRFRRRHLLQTGRHLTEKSRMLTLPGLPVHPAHPGSRLLARRSRAGATGSPDAKNHPAAKRRRVSINKNKTAARNHREKHSQNISHPKKGIKRSGAMHFRMAPLVFRVSGPRSKDGGRKQSLPAPVRKTAAGNSHCRPPFEIPRPETFIGGPRSKYRGREQSLPAPVRNTEAGNSNWRPPFERRRPGTVIAGPRSKYRGRKQSLPPPVRTARARNSHSRPPFEIPRPVTIIAGPRSKYRGRKQSLPAPVRNTEAGNSHWRPPFERRRPGTVIAGPRSKDGGRKQSLPA